MYYNTKNTKKLKPGLVASYDIRPRNRVLAVYKSVTYLLTHLLGWSRGTMVERRSLAGELSLSCAWPAADGWPLMWVNHPL